MSGGFLYGAAGIAVGVRVIVQKIIITGHKVNKVNDAAENGVRFIEQAKADFYFELFPRGVAGIFSGGSGCVVLPFFILKKCY